MCVNTNGNTGKHFLGDWYHCSRLYFHFNNCPVECGAWLVSGWPADQNQARDGFFQTPSRYLSHFTLVNNFHLGSLARGKHLVQALPAVFALQCITGKADNKINNCKSTI